MGFKLVRDGQREFCLANGVSGRWRTSPDPVRALVKKLFEEAAEFAEELDPAELYDLRDVLRELLHLCDRDKAAETAHARKIASLGLFCGHLEWCPVPDEERDGK